jgi:hypothetical protein
MSCPQCQLEFGSPQVSERARAQIIVLIFTPTTFLFSLLCRHLRSTSCKCINCCRRACSNWRRRTSRRPHPRSFHLATTSQVTRAGAFRTVRATRALTHARTTNAPPRFRRLSCSRSTNLSITHQVQRMWYVHIFELALISVDVDVCVLALVPLSAQWDRNAATLMW